MFPQLLNYYRVAGVAGALKAVCGKLASTSALHRVRRHGIRHPVTLRLPSSDALTFQQVFMDEEYRAHVRGSPGVIVDAGANIGLASVWFANLFPSARIVAIEPDGDNYALLRRNVEPYPNVTTLHAALWNENRMIDLFDPGVGAWGYTVGEAGALGAAGSNRATVRGMTVDAVMDSLGVQRVDILKLDVEGAEREVLADSSAWVSRVDALIVELHDRSKPGCREAFEACVAGFDERWVRGENEFAVRASSCIGRG